MQKTENVIEFNELVSLIKIMLLNVYN